MTPLRIGFNLPRHRPQLLLIEDHLTSYRTHLLITRQGYRLVKRTGLNNWYIPRAQAFALSDRGERWALWQKLWLRTPFRAARASWRRGLVRHENVAATPTT